MVETIPKMLRSKKRLKTYLSVCAACGLCAKSCFLYQNKQDFTYIPSYKVRKSLGVMFKKKGKLSRSELEQMSELVWGKCAMCRRCYCPFGIDLSGMIAFARSILRSQGIFEPVPNDKEKH